MAETSPKPFLGIGTTEATFQQEKNSLTDTHFWKKEKKPNILLPPQPVLTQSATWIAAACIIGLRSAL